MLAAAGAALVRCRVGGRAAAARRGGARPPRRSRAHCEADGGSGRRMAAGSYAFRVPVSEEDLMAQAQTAALAALADGHALVEVEMPPVDTRGVSTGDSIAISEYNAALRTVRRFVAVFEQLGTSESVRVWFPDSGEADIALHGAGINPASGQWEQEAEFHDWAGGVDALLGGDIVTKLSLLSQGYATGGRLKKGVADEVEIEDRLYVIAYPYESDDELVAAMQVWETAWARRPMLFINGNLDAARTRWSAPWDSKGKKMREDFLPRVEAAFYMHHFRSQAGGGMLLRAYPGPWRVLRRDPSGGYVCVEETDERPELREVALQYFSGGLTTSSLATAPEGAVAELSDDNTGFYAALGLERDASRAELSVAYRTLAREHHPDVGGDAMRFYELTRAYAVLKDARKRALYDEHGERFVEFMDSDAGGKAGEASG